MRARSPTWSASDSSVIEAYFAAHTDITPKSGDVFVVTTIVGDKEYEKSAYQYTGTAWEAMTGNVDAVQGHHAREPDAGGRLRPHRQLDEG